MEIVASWTVTVAILGARMHYAVPSVLADHGRLERYYTDWYSADSGWLGRIRRLLLHAPVNTLRRAAMRSSVTLPEEAVHSFPWLGIRYALVLRTSSDEVQREQTYVQFGRQFAQSAVKAGFGQAKAVYGMNSASLELFQAASSQRITCILEQCIAPRTIQMQLLQEEYNLWPAWEAAEIGNTDFGLAARERQEWALADLILAGSDFVKDGLVANGVDKEKCFVLPYTVDVNAYQPNKEKPRHNGLRVLFLGQVGLRKGIHYLHRSLELTKTDLIEVKAAGTVSLNPAITRQVAKRIHLLGLVPRAKVRNLLQWADVLVLPSICEGSAMVTYEALASGVPVITTPNAGSPVQDGVTGFIVPNRSAAAIASRLDQLATDPQLRQDMSSAARRYAEEQLSWDAYAKRLIATIETALAGDI